MALAPEEEQKSIRHAITVVSGILTTLIVCVAGNHYHTTTLQHQAELNKQNTAVTYLDTCITQAKANIRSIMEGNDNLSDNLKTQLVRRYSERLEQLTKLKNEEKGITPEVQKEYFCEHTPPLLKTYLRQLVEANFEVNACECVNCKKIRRIARHDVDRVTTTD